MTDRHALVAKIAAAVQDGGLAAIANDPPRSPAGRLAGGRHHSWCRQRVRPPLADVRRDLVTRGPGDRIRSRDRGCESGQAGQVRRSPRDDRLRRALLRDRGKTGVPPGPNGLDGVPDRSRFLAPREDRPSPALRVLPRSVAVAEYVPHRRRRLARHAGCRRRTASSVSGRSSDVGPGHGRAEGRGLGGPRGREDLAIIPVAGPGTVPGLLGDLAFRGGLAPPVAPESPLALGSRRGRPAARRRPAAPPRTRTG